MLQVSRIVIKQLINECVNLIDDYQGFEASYK